jgi:hypothetical protein
MNKNWWLPLTLESRNPKPSASKTKSENGMFFEPDKTFARVFWRFVIVAYIIIPLTQNNSLSTN